jgi:hypothetical protein
MCADGILRGAMARYRAHVRAMLLLFSALAMLTCHDTTCGRDASDRAHDAATTWKQNAHAWPCRQTRGRCSVAQVCTNTLSPRIWKITLQFVFPPQRFVVVYSKDHRNVFDAEYKHNSHIDHLGCRQVLLYSIKKKNRKTKKKKTLSP